MRPYYDYSPPARGRFRRWRSLAPATRIVIIAAAASAAVELVLWNAGGAGGEWWRENVFLTPRLALAGGRPWQFLTFLLVQPPGGVWTLLGTVVLLYAFGPEVERRLGPGRFVLLYLACGLGSGAAALLWPDRSLAGATGAVLGLATLYALLWPDHPLHVFVTVRAKWVVLVLVGVPALVKAGVAAGKGAVPYLPELGGPAAALAAGALARLARGRVRRSAPVSAPAGTAAGGVPGSAVDRRRLDRILEKVHERGIGSLTRRERRLLERASAELRRRSRSPRG